MDPRSNESHAQITAEGKNHEAAIAELKRAHEAEKKKLLKTISKLRVYNERGQPILKLQDDLEDARQKNKALESKIADYEERMHLIRGLSNLNEDRENTPDCKRVSDEPDSEERQGNSRRSEGETPEKQIKGERELPFSFTQNSDSVTGDKKRDWSGSQRAVDFFGDAQPCEPGLNSEEFRQFLKRRREECSRNAPNYKYVDVVRNKEVRKKLEAFECADCKAFYASLNVKDELPTCGHRCKTPTSSFSSPISSGDPVSQV